MWVLGPTGFESAKIRMYEQQAMQRAAQRSMQFHEQVRFQLWLCVTVKALVVE